MIQLYAKGTTDFSKSGLEMRPTESTVTFQDNGQFDLEMVVPADGGFTGFDYDQILKATVPTQKVAAVTLGTVSYYTVTKESGTNLLSSVPVTSGISYTPWTLAVYYSVGTNVTYNRNNYTCTNAHYSQNENAPGSGSAVWSAIPNSQTTGGASIETLENGATVMKTADFNASYMEAATLDGKTGYIKIADCTATGESESRVIPARTIREQLFVVTEVQKEEQGKAFRITAEHISYQLGRTMLGDCNVVGVSPATAVLFIQGAMQESYSGNIYTNIADVTIDADWSWKNAQAALLDPKAGLLTLTGGRMIRDNLDVYMLAEGTPAPAYSVRYGANMTGVKWTGNVGDIVTRIYPIAQTEDGRTLLLPEKYIDSVRTIPFVKPETLNTGLKVGQKVTNSDGTETELTEAEIYTRMREAASNRFNIDKCDQAEVNLDLDWIHMPDTEEYAEFAELDNAAPGDWVEVVNGPLGINELIRLTGYTWDPMAEIYKSTTFGDLKTKPTVAGYSLKSGSVTARALAAGSVGGYALQQDSITAREIEANSITADLIASKSIVTELLAANAVTADEINAGSVTADKVAAGAITTVKLDAQAVTAEKIDAGAVTAEKIDAGAVTADKIAAGSVTAVKIAANAITSDKIDAGAITAVKIAAGAVTAGKIDAGAVTAAAIDAGAVTAVAIASDAVTSDKIYAGAVVADKIASGAVTTAKLDAYAVTADKIAAGAIDADKIAANAITAAKISASDLTAIQAKLQIADIADAHIASADINYAHVKDLVAGTAIFDTTITEQGVGDRLFINRLMVTYGQMVEATIGDLVIGASDGYYYHVDVEWDDNGVPALVPTRVATPSAAEIAAGHTTGGKTIIGNVGTFADLSSENFYAINSIIDIITAKRIDVDELWAREAFIDKLMVTDISSNTYIRSTIGDWQSSSTITQTVDGLNTRISELGYGTVYMQPDEPDHSHLSSGDVWIQTLADTTWQEIYNNTTDYPTWQAIYNNVSTWQTLGAIPIMWVWDGRNFQLMYDALLPTNVETEIQQLATAITLKASKDELDILSGEVTEFRAQLTIQADEIEAAVSAVNAKAASYVMWADPRTAYSVSLGDIWVKRDPDFCDQSSWQDVYDNFLTWNQLYSVHDAWDDMLGDRSFMWDGLAWVETSDRASEIYQKTLIDQTATQVAIIAETSANIDGVLYELRSDLTVANDRISAEVSRAVTAESQKIAKTEQLQTADQIVSKAVSDAASAAAGSYVTKTTRLQTADQIVSEAVSQASSSASDSFIAKTTSLQTANQIVNEAVRVAGANASGENGYIAKTSTYQTADAIKNEAVREAGANATAGFIAKTETYQTAEAIKTEAVRAAGENATSSFIAKTTAYQTAEAIKNEAVRVAGENAAGTYLQKTTTYQTADAIVNTAIGRVAPEFSTSTNYNVGEIVAYHGRMYRFTQYHAAGNWNGAQVETIRTTDAYIAQTSTYQTASQISLDAKYESAKNVAPEFKTTRAYSTGDIVSHYGKVWKFRGNKSAGDWNVNFVDQINLEENVYQLRSYIDIIPEGIEISGGKYIKIKSGSTEKITLDATGIVMETAGKFVLNAKNGDNSSILFGEDAEHATFSVGDSGNLKCNDLQVMGNLSVNGSWLPQIVVSKSEPSSSNVIWIQPGGTSEKNINFRPNHLTMDTAGGIGYYRVYEISYTGADSMTGDTLYYGITARLQFYNMSGYANHTFRALLYTGSSYEEIATETQTVGQWATITLDTSGVSKANVLSSDSGGTFWIRLETTANGNTAMLLNEDIVVKARNSSTANFSVCTVRYKQ